MQRWNHWMRHFTCCPHQNCRSCSGGGGDSCSSWWWWWCAWQQLEQLLCNTQLLSCSWSRAESRQSVERQPPDWEHEQHQVRTTQHWSQLQMFFFHFVYSSEKFKINFYIFLVTPEMWLWLEIQKCKVCDVEKLQNSNITAHKNYK